MSLEIRPEKFTIVVGPTFAAEIVREILSENDVDVRLPTFDFKSIVDRGVSYLLKKETFASHSDREKFVARYDNAYELDPVFVLRKIISSLQSAECYKEWLAELFACNLPSKKASKSLQRLLLLQSQGALVVYVHCDDVIARAAGQETVLLENSEQMERWAKGECAGIMQPHGVYSQSDTVKLDCLLYDSTTHPLNAAVERLREVLCSRNTILLGEDWDRSSNDPFLTHFCKRFMSERSTEPNSFVFTTAKNATDLPGLPLHPPSPFPTLFPTTSASADLWKQIKVDLVPSSPPCQYQVVCLLVSGQTGARDISHMMFNAPGVNFALVNPVTYDGTPAYCVSLRVLSSSLRQLWGWLLTSSHDVLLACGLTAVVLQDGTFLWLQDPVILSHRGDVADCSSSSADINTRSANNTAGISSPASTTSTMHNVHSTGPPIAISPSTQIAVGCGSEARTHNKIIQRYKVVRKRSQIMGAGGSHSDMGSYGGHFLAKTCEDADTMSRNTRKYLYARRGSLPPIKCGEPGNALVLLTERLQHSEGPSSSPTFPSYVAIKRALLSDKFKNVQNPIAGLAVPKMLLHLLQAKKDPDEKPNLLAYRRNSDPGSYLQHRDKTRRRQLFLDENMQWLKTHSPVIERKIRAWNQKRLLRMQREYFYAQQEKLNKQSEIHLLNPGKLIPSLFYSSLASSTVASSLASLPQTFVAAAGSGVNGFSAAPLMYQLPSAGLTPTPVLVPAPFVSPYAFMGSYTTIPVTAAAQPATAYIMPPTALTAGGQQRVVFLPTAGSASTTGGTPASMVLASDHTTNTKPQISSLLAPTSSAVSEPAPAIFSSSRKRKNAFPEKLSSLLQPASDPEPASPPEEKRVCTAGHMTHKDTRHRHCSVSPPPPQSHTHSSSHSSSHTSSHSTCEHRSHHSHPHHHHRHHHHYHHSHHSSSHHYSHPSSPHSHHPHSHQSPSPLEQCLLQSPLSPGSDCRAPESPGGSPSSFSSAPSTDHSSHSPPQLWQFLLELLLTANCSHLIQWTSSAQECEFTIHEPVQVAELWGKVLNNSAMNYDKLAKGLCYYYSKGIIEKVDGKKLTFRYNGLARSYVQHHCRKTADVTGSMEEMVVVE